MDKNTDGQTESLTRERKEAHSRNNDNKISSKIKKCMQTFQTNCPCYPCVMKFFVSGKIIFANIKCNKNFFREEKTTFEAATVDVTFLYLIKFTVQSFVLR